MDERLAERKVSQPVGVKSAGCIFKNPSGDSAGRIIDGLGLKGLRMGGAWVSEVHANFIVHDGAARAGDVMALVDEIRDRVYRATSIELEEEVKRWT
jgi:UDP-N-acetylmuramate dehydrogenase